MRDPGFYWIKLQSGPSSPKRGWTIGEWYQVPRGERVWLIVGSPSIFFETDNVIVEVGERILLPAEGA